MWKTLRSAMGPWGIVPFGDPMPDNSLGDMNALAKEHAALRAKRLAASSAGSLGGPPPAAPAAPAVAGGYNPRMGRYGAAPAAAAPPMDMSVFDTPPAVAPAGLGLGGGYNPRMGQFGGRPQDSVAPPVQPLDDAPQRGVPQAPPSLPWAGFGGPGIPAHAPAPAPVAQTAAPQPAPQVPMPQARPAEAPQAQPDTSFFMRNALSMRDPSTGELIDPSGAQSIRGPDLISKMMGYLHQKV